MFKLTLMGQLRSFALKKILLALTKLDKSEQSTFEKVSCGTGLLLSIMRTFSHVTNCYQ